MEKQSIGTGDNVKVDADAELVMFSPQREHTIVIELKFKTTFPLFAKIPVKGDAAHPLYKYLTGLKENGGEVAWNFNKFLVSPEGTVVAHLASGAEPTSDEVKKKVEAVLPKK